MYAVENDGRFGLSDHFTKEINLKIEDEFILYNERKNPTEYMINILKPSFFLSSSPALYFSSTNNVLFRNRVVIVPMHVFSDMLNKCSNFFDSTNSKSTRPSTVFENIPIGEVLIKTNKDDKESIKEINSVISSNKNYSVSTWVYAERKTDMDKTKNFISLLFSMIALVILVFCFFNLTASMSINMYEQQKEIAVFRSQGLTKGGLKLIYVIESFILIVSSCFLGLLTGTILSWTSLIQRVYFTNLPLRFEFPYIELFFLVLFAVLGGFLSTYFTVRKISEKQICSLIKSG